MVRTPCYNLTYIRRFRQPCTIYCRGNFLQILFMLLHLYVSGAEKGDHFALKVDFELVVLRHSTVDGSLLHFVALQ